jgi:hypothetical protein
MTRVWAFLLVVAALTLPASAQDVQAPPLYELLPADGSYPIARVCYTDAGICALPLEVPAGQACACRRPDGTWVSGVCTH